MLVMRSEVAIERYCGLELLPRGTSPHLRRSSVAAGPRSARSGSFSDMPIAQANGIELYYDTLGESDDPPLLLIMGLGAQAIAWSEEFCQGFVDRGFFVIRFDNRDIGLSTKFEGTPNLMTLAMAAMSGQPVEAPYTIADMAADAAALLDHLGVAAAHVVGASMGGMIAQQLAIDHPGRVSSLTSIMSTTGEPDVGQPAPEAISVLLAAAPTTREDVLARAVAAAAVIGSPEHGDQDRTRAIAGAQYDRCFRPDGPVRQLACVLASGSRAEGLAALEVPTLVLHGTEDKLVNVSGGERTAELVPGAELQLLEGMGHDLPVYFWSRVIESITRHAATAASAQ